MSKTKLFITDIDGVWTDGGMYYSTSGEELKKFNTSDSAGVLFARNLNIPVCIITGEDTPIVVARAKKLKIDHLFLGVSNKIHVAQKLIEELNISWEEVAFIGDDVNDIPLLKMVGISACPSQAPSYVKSAVNNVLEIRGGDGAFRFFVELVLSKEGRLQEALDIYFKKLKFDQ